MESARDWTSWTHLLSLLKELSLIEMLALHYVLIQSSVQLHNLTSRQMLVLLGKKNQHLLLMKLLLKSVISSRSRRETTSLSKANVSCHLIQKFRRATLSPKEMLKRMLANSSVTKSPRPASDIKLTFRSTLKANVLFSMKRRRWKETKLRLPLVTYIVNLRMKKFLRNKRLRDLLCRNLLRFNIS